MIKSRKDITDVNVSDGKLSENDFNDAYVQVPKVPEIKKPTSFWKDTWVGRTLTLRTKTGKVGAGVLTAAISTVFGIDLSPIINPLIGVPEMEPIIDLFSGIGWTELITVALLIITSVSVSLGYFTKRMKSSFMEAWEVFKRARMPESDGGVKVTNEEKAELFDRVVDFVEATLSRFGINLDLNNDGK